MKQAVRLLPIVAALSIFTACAPEPRLEWPGWRGPDGLGIGEGHPLPVEWSTDSPNIRWRAPVPGVGNSSPVVAEGRVFLTTAYRVGEKEKAVKHRVVVAHDLETGEQLWETRLFSAEAETKHLLNTLAAPTPATDGEGVYAYFGSHLARLDIDGEVVWQVEVDPDYAEHSRYGAASSPVLTESSVIVVQDREYADVEDDGWLAAFDKESGVELWRTTWRDTCCAYSTPLVTHRGGETEIVFAHSGAVSVFSAETGELLWKRPYEINQMVASPVYEGDILGISGGAHNVRRTVFLRLSGEGKETDNELLWENRRLVPQTSSPVLYQGLFYTVTDPGVVACYEPESGELVWAERLPHAKNRGSMVAGDGKIYIQAGNDRVSVIEAGREFNLLAVNSLDEPPSNASPAIADGCLLVRTRSHLVCIEGDEPAKPADA